MYLKRLLAFLLESNGLAAEVTAQGIQVSW